MPSPTEPARPVWRFVHTGRRSAAANMAIDEAMLIAHQSKLTPPTLRFYGWEPAALSIGYFQQANREVDFDSLRSRGVSFVRRPTGGRAVLHDRELTYSLVVSESYPGVPEGVEEACRKLSEGLMLGFRRLGINPQISGDKQPPAHAADPESGSAACFDTPSRYELVLQGRKIAGSSQMRAKGVILQHGSIPLELDTDLLFAVLRHADEEDKRRKRHVFDRKAICLGDCFRNNGMPMPAMSDLEAAIRDGFAEALSAKLVTGALMAEEEELAARLAQTKYEDEKWNRLR